MHKEKFLKETQYTKEEIEQRSPDLIFTGNKYEDSHYDAKGEYLYSGWSDVQWVSTSGPYHNLYQIDYTTKDGTTDYRYFFESEGSAQEFRDVAERLSAQPHH